MKRIWMIVSTLAIANMLAVIGLLAWLHTSDRLSKDRLQSIRSMLAVTHAQEEQTKLGERVLSVFREPGAEIIAEDLGVIPDFVRASLDRLGVPGFRVFRWERQWHDPSQPFRDPLKYPPLSVATSGTHDTEPLIVWWEGAPREEREAFFDIPFVAQRLAGEDRVAALEARHEVVEGARRARLQLALLDEVETAHRAGQDTCSDRTSPASRMVTQLPHEHLHRRRRDRKGWGFRQRLRCRKGNIFGVFFTLRHTPPSGSAATNARIPAGKLPNSRTTVIS